MTPRKLFAPPLRDAAKIFRPLLRQKKYVSKMPQKQEKMSFKNVWKKIDKIKKI